MHPSSVNRKYRNGGEVLDKALLNRIIVKVTKYRVRIQKAGFQENETA